MPASYSTLIPQVASFKRTRQASVTSSVTLSLAEAGIGLSAVSVAGLLALGSTEPSHRLTRVPTRHRSIGPRKHQPRFPSYFSETFYDLLWE